jgi:hypothetical protein
MLPKEKGGPEDITPRGPTSDYNTISYHTDGAEYTPPDQSGDGAKGMRRYFDAVFRDTTGWVTGAIGHDPFISPNGKYTHDLFAPFSFLWPDPEIDAIIELLLEASHKADVYVCPYLMREEGKRAKGQAVDHLLLHADIDGDAFDAVKAQRITSIGGFAIDSGTPNHAHVYVPLSESVSVEQHEALCIGLGTYIGGADLGKHTDENVLRPPGTLNHKSRVFDKLPQAPVRWLP